MVAAAVFVMIWFRMVSISCLAVSFWLIFVLFVAKAWSQSVLVFLISVPSGDFAMLISEICSVNAHPHRTMIIRERAKTPNHIIFWAVRL